MAACAFSATAQSNVYSLNVVGYYNVTVPANQLVAVANQLNTSDNKISSLLPAGPAGALLYKYNGGYTAYAFDDADNVWTPSEPTLNVGEAFFYKKSPTATQNKWIRNFTVQ